MNYDLTIIVIGGLWIAVICLVLIHYHLIMHQQDKKLTELQVEIIKLRSDFELLKANNIALDIDLKALTKVVKN